MAENSSEEATLAVVIILVILLTFALVYLWKHAVLTVRHAEVMIIERLGKYKTTLKPGLHFVWPIIEAPREINWRYLDAKHNSAKANVVIMKTDRIDMREHVIDFGHQDVITKDTVQISIDALVYFRITDPRVAVFQVQNLPDAIELLTQATLRNIIALMTLDDTFSSREQINSSLLSKIQRDCERWGVAITRVEIFNIRPPADIREAMENQIRSERDRRSTVLRADGNRESAVIRSRGDAAKVVLNAEGFRASEVLRAKGKADAKKLLAQAEARGLTDIRNAVKESGMRGVDYMVAVEYLNALARLSMNAKKTDVVLIPTDAVDHIGSVMAMNGHLPGGGRSGGGGGGGGGSAR